MLLIESRPAVRIVTCRTALNPTGIPGYRYCLNPYVGCTHGCRYCYAVFMKRFREREEAWGTFVDIKINLPEVLRRQLGARKAPAGKVLLGTVTDPYQPIERKACIVRSCLEMLADYPLLEIDVLTKSDLVVRDLSLLLRLKKCRVGFTITTPDDRVARILEPGASPPSARLAALGQLRRAGLSGWVFVAPLLPGIGDAEETLTGLLQECQNAGAQQVYVDALNPYPSVVRRLWPTYRRYFPAALKNLDRYLTDRRTYLRGLAGMLRRLSRQYGYDLSLSC